MTNEHMMSFMKIISYPCEITLIKTSDQNRATSLVKRGDIKHGFEVKVFLSSIKT